MKSVQKSRFHGIGCIASMVAIALIFPATSCGLGLTPAKNGTRTSLSIALGSIVPPGAESGNRAIVQGSGYLYVRTVGGPDGVEGPFYGPYPSSPGSSVTIFDIPAGSYSEMYIVFTPRILPETPMLTWQGSVYSFPALMRLDDASFLQTVGSDEKETGVEIIDENYFQGEISGGIIGPVELKENAVNRVTAVLTPFNEPLYAVNLFVSESVVLPASATLIKKFYIIEGIVPPVNATSVDMKCEIAPAAGNDVTLGTVAWFDGSGSLIASFPPAGTVSAATSFDVTISSPDYAYLYVEYASASPVTATFSGSNTVIPEPVPPVPEPVPPVPVPPTVYTCTASYQYPAGAAGAGEILFFAVHDVTGVSPTGTTFPIEQAGTRVALGMITLDSSGAGSAVAVDPATGNPAELVVGHTYEIHSFLDLTDDYDAITDISEVLTVESGMIVPNYGDYSSDVPTPFTVTSGITNSAVTLGAHVSHSKRVYFVKSGATGGSLKYSDPGSFDVALSTIMSTGYDAEVFVIGNISMVSPYTFVSKVFLRGCDPALAGNPVVTHPGGLASMFTVTSGGSLVLARITLDATAEIAVSTAKVVVNSGALIMADGSVISGVNASQASGNACSGVNGAGVAVSGGTLEMYGNATIRDCKGYNGAGVYVTGTNGSIKMFGSSLIENCVGANGGGVVIEGGIGLTMLMDDSSAIKNCVASGGAGVKIGTGVSSFTMKGSSSITGCAADGTTNGGGIAVWDSTVTFTLMDFATISGNTAGMNGGGVYCGFTDPGWSDYSAYVFGNTQYTSSTPTLEPAGVYFIP